MRRKLLLCRSAVCLAVECVLLTLLWGDRRWELPFSLPPIRPFRQIPWHNSQQPVLPKGRRLAKLKKLQEQVDLILKIEENYQASLGKKRQWMNTDNRWRKLRNEYKQRGITLQSVCREITDWLPEALSTKGTYSEPVKVEDVGDLFKVFVPEISEGLRPALQDAFHQVLPTSDLKAVITMLDAMLMAKVPHGPAYQTLGTQALQKCVNATDEDIASLAWSLASAKDTLPVEDWEDLKDGCKVRFIDIPRIDVRRLASACGDVGLSIPEVFGVPPFEAGVAKARWAWNSLAQVADKETTETLSNWPAPVLLVPNAISEESANVLVKLADNARLWKASARQGPGSANPGAPISGRPWSALLGGPIYGRHPAVVALRHWVASVLNVPSNRVEEPRLVRYREGDCSGRAAADARPPGDPTLWLSGQRTLAVQIFLGSVPIDAGGETLFRQLGLKVSPQAYSALIWPTVNATGFPESRVAREALPVLEQDLVKYTLTTWVRCGPAPGEHGE